MHKKREGAWYLKLPDRDVFSAINERGRDSHALVNADRLRARKADHRLDLVSGPQPLSPRKSTTGKMVCALRLHPLCTLVSAKYAIIETAPSMVHHYV